jgi:hypothetical protein
MSTIMERLRTMIQLEVLQSLRLLGISKALRELRPLAFALATAVDAATI